MDPAEGMQRRKEKRELRRKENRRRWYLAVIAGGIAAIIVVFAAWHIYVSKECEKNERRAIDTLREILQAENRYHYSFDCYANLQQLHRNSLITYELSQATTPEQALGGYYYKTMVGAETWYAVAKPAIPCRTGRVSFYVDDTEVVRFKFFRSEDDIPARSDSPVLP